MQEGGGGGREIKKIKKGMETIGHELKMCQEGGERGVEEETGERYKNPLVPHVRGCAHTFAPV